MLVQLTHPSCTTSRRLRLLHGGWGWGSDADDDAFNLCSCSPSGIILWMRQQALGPRMWALGSGGQAWISADSAS